MDRPPSGAQLEGPAASKGVVVEEADGPLYLDFLRQGHPADQRNVELAVGFVHVVRTLGGKGVEVGVQLGLGDGIGDIAAPFVAVLEPEREAGRAVGRDREQLAAHVHFRHRQLVPALVDSFVEPERRGHRRRDGARAAEKVHRRAAIGRTRPALPRSALGPEAILGQLRVERAEVGGEAGVAAESERRVPVPALERPEHFGRGTVDARDHADRVEVPPVVAAREFDQPAANVGQVDAERVELVGGRDNDGRGGEAGEERLGRQQDVRLAIDEGNLRVDARVVGNMEFTISEERDARRRRDQVVDGLVVVEIGCNVEGPPAVDLAGPVRIVAR